MKKTSTKAKMLVGAMAITIVILGLFLGDILSLAGEVAPTDATINMYDFYDNAEMDADDYNGYLYRVDISAMTQDEIDDIVFADYSYWQGIISGESYTPDSDYKYLLKVNGTDIIERWIDEPVLGANNMYIANATEDVAIACYSTDELDVSIANTTYDEWTIRTQCLDAAEGTGSPTLKEGYRAFYNYSGAVWETVVLRVEFNTTAVLSYCELKGVNDEFVYTEKASGNYLYYEMRVDIIGSTEFRIDFSSDVGYIESAATVSAQSIDLGYGNSDYYTEWDSQ